MSKTLAGGVSRLPPEAEAAWRLGGWVVLCQLVRSGELESGWYACPACGGSGEAVGSWRPDGAELTEYCGGCEGDGHRRVCSSWASRPATPAWARI